MISMTIILMIMMHHDHEQNDDDQNVGYSNVGKTMPYTTHLGMVYTTYLS